MRLFLLTSLTMLAFAANSILNRAALSSGDIGAADFAMIRTVSGALMLALILRLRAGHFWALGEVSFGPAFGLAVYLVGFAFAYQSLEAGVGALILFGTVQVIMMGWGLFSGERPGPLGIVGILLALAGLLILTLPGASAPDPLGAALMAAAGVGWGYYSIYGKGVHDPLAATAGNFLMAVPLALIVWLGFASDVVLRSNGVLLAVVSGAVTSGLGYALWYRVLPDLRRISAALAQLSVPVLAIVAGVILLGEQPGWLVVLASGLILGGIFLSLKR